MQKTHRAYLVHALPLCLFLLAVLAGCALDQRDEVIGGVALPIPRGMSKAGDQTIELTIPGFEGGQAAYQGRVAPEEIVGFYRREMPARGWTPNASLVSQGGFLAYSKDNRSVLITVANNSGGTRLAILVGATTFQNRP